jgi:hypothetical protein
MSQPCFLLLCYGWTFLQGSGRLEYWPCSAIFKTYLQWVLAANILTVGVVVCTLAVKKKSGQVSTCRIGPFPCQCFSADISYLGVGLLKDALNISDYIASDVVRFSTNVELEWRSWPRLRCYSGIFLERLRKIIRNLSGRSVSLPKFETVTFCIQVSVLVASVKFLGGKYWV